MNTEVSILVLTLNEERNIGACLDALTGFDDIVILDSFSSDATCDIARSRGARVYQRRFDNWASHQNWAMEHVQFKNAWVFYLDADEHMTPSLRAEIVGIATDSSRSEVAYYCGRRNFFMGKWIRHAMPPGMIMRFFRPECVRFERLVNPVPVIDGTHGYLSPGVSDLLSRDRFRRRKALKDLSFRIPLRPAVKFLWMYVLKLGFLDGRAGFTYCRLQAIYEYMIVVKMQELARIQRGLPT